MPLSMPFVVIVFFPAEADVLVQEVGQSYTSPFAAYPVAF